MKNNFYKASFFCSLIILTACSHQRLKSSEISRLLKGQADSVEMNFSEEAKFLTLINNYRSSHGLGLLKASISLKNASLWLSKDMATKNYFDHVDSLGNDFLPRIKSFGYSYNTYLGENIAAGRASAEEVFAQWKGSPGHNFNMLNPNYKAIGIARVKDNKESSIYRWLWTTDFGGFVD